MKISAEGARRSVYRHEVADEGFDKVAITSKGNLRVKIRTLQNPGIGSGVYDLTLTFSKKEALRLYEKAVIAEEQMKLRKQAQTISKLEGRIDDLERKLG